MKNHAMKAINLFIPENMLEIIDFKLREMQIKFPGIRLTRSDMLRNFISIGMNQDPSECSLCQKHNQPNQETIKTLTECNKKIGLSKSYVSVKKMFEDLNKEDSE